MCDPVPKVSPKFEPNVAIYASAPAAPDLIQLANIFDKLDARGRRTVLAAAVEQFKIIKGE